MADQADRDQIVRILRAVRRVIRSVGNFGKQLQANFGVSGPQLICLRALYDEEGSISIQELGRQVFLTSGTLTGIIDRLERKAYVRRVRSQTDRRKVMLEITEAGRKLVEYAPHPLEMRLLEGLKRREPGAAQVLCEQMEALVEMLEAQSLGAEPVLDTGTLATGEMMGGQPPLPQDEGEQLEDRGRSRISPN